MPPEGVYTERSLRMRRSKHPGARGIAAAVIAAALVAAVSASVAAPASNTSGAPGVAAAKAQIAQAMHVPAFGGPTQKLDATGLKGKTVWIIDNSLQNPFNTELANAAIDALKRVGITTKLIDGKGQTTEWTRQIELAAAQKPDAVIGSGLTTEFLKGPLKQLAAAGVPFVDDLINKTASEPAGVSAKIGVDNPYSGSNAAAVAVATMSNSSPGVLILNDSEFATSVGVYVNAAKAYLAKNCPACKVTVKDELFANAATHIPGDVADILRANPGIKWIIAGYDYQAGFAVQGLRQAGLTGVNVVASGGSPPQLNMVRAGNSPYIADQLVSGTWAGWAGADEAMRLILKMPVKTEVVPFRLLTKANIAPTNDAGALIGTDFMTPYLKLWGVNT
jgi:ribose transport system substrate-binding protein